MLIHSAKVSFAQIQALGHFAMLRAETGQHPHRSVGDRTVGGEHVRVLLAVGQRPQALDRLVVVVGEHHRAGAAVVAPRQRTSDRLQRRRPARRAVDPVGQLRGGGLLAGCQESRNGQRYNGSSRFFGFEFLACHLEQSLGLVGQAGQFWLVLGRVARRAVLVFVVIADELAVLVHPDAAHVDRVCLGLGRLCRLGFRLWFWLNEIRRQHLAQHQVRVRTAEAEAGHSCDRVAAVARPVGDGIGHLQPHRLEVDVRVGTGVVDRGRNLVVLERKCHLGQAGGACGRFQVSHIGFHRTQQCGFVDGTALADDAAKRVGLDRVTKDGAGAVRLDVVDVARVDTGVLIRLA